MELRGERCRQGVRAGRGEAQSVVMAEREGVVLAQIRKPEPGVPIVVQRKQIRLGTMRFQIQSLTDTPRINLTGSISLENPN